MKNNNLSVIAFVNGFTLWHYVDSKVSSTQLDENFFSEMGKLTSIGDKILLNLSDCYAEAIITQLSGSGNNIKVYFKYITKLMYKEEGETDEQSK